VALYLRVEDAPASSSERQVSERKQPTVIDVATRAGVAVGTVSRVINHSEAVSQGTREAVWRAIADLGYRPNSIARSMRTRTTRTIGFVIPDISNPLFATIARNAELVLQNEGFLLNIASSDDNVEREVRLISVFAERQCDGLILVTNRESDPRILEALRSSRLPLLVLDRELELDVDRVMSDHALGVLLAVEYLLELGHRRIALINVSERIAPGRARARGFREAFLQRGLRVDEELIRTGRFDQGFGVSQTDLLLDLARPPSAIVAGGNQILVGVLQALQARKVRVPSDISLIGCDDTPVTQVFWPPITIIDRDVARIGRTAAQMMLERLQDSSATGEPSTVLLPTELRVRGSCTAVR
jgi:LacI family transcriptional regulator